MAQFWRGEVGVEPDSRLDHRQADGFAAREGNRPHSPHLFDNKILSYIYLIVDIEFFYGLLPGHRLYLS